MNLERNSSRTQEISEMLFNTYRSQIQFTSDTSLSVSFSKNSSINISDLSDPTKIKLPYGIGVYEPTLMMSMISETNIDLDALDRIRTNFVKLYFDNGHNKTYPNVLFDYHKQINDKGHIEAYNHWILMKGDEDAFSKWCVSNKDQWDSFLSWF